MSFFNIYSLEDRSKFSRTRTSKSKDANGKYPFVCK